MEIAGWKESKAVMEVIGDSPPLCALYKSMAGQNHCGGNCDELDLLT